jgi:hypothetical protein
MSDLKTELEESTAALMSSYSEGGWHAKCAKCERIDFVPAKERVIAEREFNGNGWQLGANGDLCGGCFVAMVKEAKSDNV